MPGKTKKIKKKQKTEEKEKLIGIFKKSKKEGKF
jgi:hypothetical protein